MALTQEKLDSLNQLCWGIYKRTFGAPFWESVADILAPQQVTPEDELRSLLGRWVSDGDMTDCIASVLDITGKRAAQGGDHADTK